MLALLAIGSSLAGTVLAQAEPFVPAIPRTWDEAALAALEVPLRDPTASPRHVGAEYYEKIPVRPVFRSAPVFHPDREPAGYLEALARQPPEVVFDAARLESKADWIAAGALVFAAPVDFYDSGRFFDAVRDRGWYDRLQVPVTKEGIVPFLRWVVREPGKVELGALACAQCHTRVLPDGSVVLGAQGNFPDDRAFAAEIRLDAAEHRDDPKAAAAFLQSLRADMHRFYSAPWVAPDPIAAMDALSAEEIADVLAAIVPGICARQGSSPYFPPRIPDLIGLGQRKYFDSSGHVVHRSIGDLMRYSALNQGADELSAYREWRPAGELPDPATQQRYSDEQLYALALFLEQLAPPPNPNPRDATAVRGEALFKRERCGSCHSGSDYSNDKLLRVEGFEPAADARAPDDVSARIIDTDPTLTSTTRRGTGYYKVPSLRGLWYRGPFEHNGRVATLEDWFDPRRLEDDYVPTGFRGAGVERRAVKGHEFGLDLTPEEQADLIAFLMTL